MSLGAILLSDTLAEVGRLRAELEQTRSAAKVFEGLWHNAEREIERLTAEIEQLRTMRMPR